MTGLPNPCDDDEEKKAIAKSKEIDKGRNFHKTRVRAIVPCDKCSAPRCIYSNKAIGVKGGPSTANKEELDRWFDREGYICGKDVPSNGFYVMRKVRCGDFVESQYYNPPDNAANRGRLITDDVCAMCFSDDDIVSRDEIIAKRDIGGHNPLLICRHCFDLGLKVPTSGGSTVVTRDRKRHKLRQKRRGSWKWRWHLAGERDEEQIKWGLAILWGLAVSREWQWFLMRVTL